MEIFLFVNMALSLGIFVYFILNYRKTKLRSFKTAWIILSISVVFQFILSVYLLQAPITSQIREAISLASFLCIIFLFMGCDMMFKTLKRLGL
jgi:hypothetical protein